MSDAGTDEKPAPRKRPAGLGRGLSALLGEIEREAPVAVGNQLGTTAPAIADGIRMVEVSDLSPHPGQPRRHFDEGALNELARSIHTRGLLQPIVVRPHMGHFQIVAGERRWRAAQRANLHQVPVIIKEFDESTALEIALIENIQREQLNAIEEGEAYARLIADFGHSQVQLGELVHKSRSHVANLMRLTELPQTVKDLISAGEISMGHARALLTSPDAETLARQVVERGLSVRETEKLAKSQKPAALHPGRERANDTRDADLAALERQLGDMLGLKVRIVHGGRGGTVTLGYSSLDQLDLICQRLSGEAI
jgi:ParB family transcriptional regulator, chromosome partitioning protein